MVLIETGERLSDRCKGDHNPTFHSYPEPNRVYERNESGILLRAAGNKEEGWLDFRMYSV